VLKYLTTELDKVKYAEHGFFTRHGDTPVGVVTVKQVHGKVCVPVKAPFAGDRPEADAIVTSASNLMIGVITADCAPVLFADKRNKIIGAAHAGWRGAIGGVLQSTVDEMRKMGSKPEDIVAAIGPCIAFDSYEVDTAFPKAFLDQDAANERFFKPSVKEGHHMFDLPGYVGAELKKTGVSTVYDIRQDTLSNEGLYYSYRRATLRGEKNDGRQVSVIAIRP